MEVYDDVAGMIFLRRNIGRLVRFPVLIIGGACIGCISTTLNVVI
jgi:hypothetical protein